MIYKLWTQSNNGGFILKILQISASTFLKSKLIYKNDCLQEEQEIFSNMCIAQNFVSKINL